MPSVVEGNPFLPEKAEPVELLERLGEHTNAVARGLLDAWWTGWPGAAPSTPGKAKGSSASWESGRRRLQEPESAGKKLQVLTVG